jgi:hypothetical protein
MKLTEDWLSVIIGFGIIIVAVLGVLQPGWFAF